MRNGRIIVDEQRLEMLGEAAIFFGVEMRHYQRQHFVHAQDRITPGDRMLSFIVALGLGEIVQRPLERVRVGAVDKIALAIFFQVEIGEAGLRGIIGIGGDQFPFEQRIGRFEEQAVGRDQLFHRFGGADVQRLIRERREEVGFGKQALARHHRHVKRVAARCRFIGQAAVGIFDELAVRHG